MCAQGSFGYFGVAVESTPGTRVAPTKFLPVKEVDFPVDVEFIDIREIAGSRQAYSSFDGPVRPDVTFTTALYPMGGMGVIMKALFGSDSAALVSPSTTAYKHSFVDAAVLPSLSFERSDTRTAGGLIVQSLSGVKIESVGFSCNYGEDVEVQVSGQGLNFPVTQTRPGSFTYPTINPMIFTGASIEIDGVASNLFKSIQFEFTNTLERQEALNKTRTAYKIMEGGMECTLSGTLVFDDLALYTKLQNSQYLTVRCKFAGSDIADALTADGGVDDILYGAEFYWPKVKVSKFGIPMTAGEVMEADVEFQVQYDKATSKLVDASFTNLDNATAYNT